MSWPVVSFGDVAQFINGDRGKNYPSKGSFVDEGIPFINAGNLSLVHTIYADALNYITEDKFNSLNSGKIEKGDILFCLRGSLGKFALVDSDMKGAIASSLVIIRVNEKINIDYLKHYLGSFLCEREIQLYENGAAQPNLSATDLKTFQIPLPPLEEQKRIAAILDKADAIRQKRKQAINLADEFLRSVFLDMFGDPVTNPKGWEVKKLKDLTSKLGSGSTPRGGKEAYLSEGISLIRSLNVHDNSFVYKELAFISDEQAEKLRNVVVKERDILLNITGASVCRCAMVPSNVLPARVNQHVCIVRTDRKQLLPEFATRLLTSTSFKQMMMSIATSGGATREALTKQQVENLSMIVPPMELQKKFCALDRKLVGFETKSKQQVSMPIFDALSQKAFSGQL
ncbi:restriction endonuclease subunit S [Vibrio anguillarum]|uniref:Restriction endonuclease subunit S n=2 Tax=Vibrio anguillarum TaxID=55601 RepID=A0ABD4QPM9_VIBAN|nr:MULTISPECIES: restriction endonuclease subunit S [Vibrio]ASG05802.1 restriction endonuclease subunit S [Vibrio anguillarum]MBF4276180.1 restriction endonuclease subunit S [Vibrio anguillarum]MBF4362977.1 restriction endonuclease subunit S [Vibrio anguillarum]MBT2917166.1 restriction endonuclease subunit S [Vibrio anguillarum]NNN98480.1 restriction endonuclease subunit S [Vibrio sp. B1-2]